MAHRYHITSLILLVASIIAVPTVAADWQGTVEKRGDVRHVLNPPHGFEPRVTGRCVEEWRHGGPGSDLVFGDVYRIIRDADGRSYLLDVQMNEIHVVGPDGELLGAIGREGEGPGEFRRASGFVMQEDGVVCVSQVMPARLVRLSSDGTALDDHPLPESFQASWVNGCAKTDAGLVVFLDAMVQQETSVGMQTLVARVNPDGTIAGECWRRVLSADLANLDFDEKADASPVRAVGRDGRFYVNVEWDAYEIQVTECGAGEVMVVSREYEHFPRPAEEIARVEKQKEEGRISPETRVATTSRDIAGLFVRPNGSLWVLSSRGEREPGEGLVAVFDEFDREGRFVREVAISGPYRPGTDSFVLYEDRMYIFPESDDENEVICMRLQFSQ